MTVEALEFEYLCITLFVNLIFLDFELFDIFPIKFVVTGESELMKRCCIILR